MAGTARQPANAAIVAAGGGLREDASGGAQQGWYESYELQRTPAAARFSTQRQKTSPR